MSFYNEEARRITEMRREQESKGFHCPECGPRSFDELVREDLNDDFISYSCPGCDRILLRRDPNPFLHIPLYDDE